MPLISKKIGTKIGRLTVLETVPRYYKNRRYTNYRCICECGKEIITALTNAKSCGCKQKYDLAERSRKEFGFAAKRAVYNYYRRNAITRNLNWNLSFEQFIEIARRDCYYCKVKPESLFTTPEGNTWCRNGIDRLDNEVGYTEINCVPCCKICNRAKKDLPLDLFLKWINSIRK